MDQAAKGMVKHQPATPRIRTAKDGISFERFDRFCEEWIQMPMYWSESECRRYVAGLYNVHPKQVRTEARPNE